MKSYNEWKKEDKNKAQPPMRKDRFGGLLPENTARAKKVDLITLPPDVQGTNCGNCLYMVMMGDHGWCEHKDVLMHVNKRMCCKLWDNDGVERSWGEMEGSGFAKSNRDKKK